MKTIITAIGTFASIIGLAFISTIPLWSRILIGFFGLVCLGVLIFDYYNNDRSNERICHSPGEIKTAMLDLIRTQGKICIMSRDLTWVDKDVEKQIAKKGPSITIFVESSTDLTKRLSKSGVIIKLYGSKGFEPTSRFTVIKYPRDPQVAIANTKYSIRKAHSFKHYIYETGGGNAQQDKWINSLAIDMIELCKLVCEDEINEKAN